MKSLEDVMRNAVTQTDAMRRDLSVRAAGDVQGLLPKDRVATRDDLEPAAEKVRHDLLDTLLKDHWLQALNGSRPLPDDSAESVRLTFRSFAAPLELPEPTLIKEMRGEAVALAASLGAVLGLVLGLRLQPAMAPDAVIVYVVLALAGAFGMAWAAWKIWERPRLQAFVEFNLGIMTVADLWLSYGPRRIWNSLRGSERFSTRWWGPMHRILVYVAIILILELGKPKVTYAAGDFEKQVRTSIGRWLTHHVQVLAVLVADEARQPVTAKPDPPDRVVEKLGPAIILLNRSVRQGDDREKLCGAIKELVLTAKVAGMEVPDSDVQELVWSEEVKRAYNPYGLIADGAAVNEVEPPVIVGGVVMKKGLVRKIKTGSARS